MRACIGKGFALQETHLAVAMILQTFELQATDPSYVMKFIQTLSIKPTGFTFHAKVRGGLDPPALERRLWGGKGEEVLQRDDVKEKRTEEVKSTKE